MFQQRDAKRGDKQLEKLQYHAEVRVPAPEDSTCNGFDIFDKDSYNV